MANRTARYLNLTRGGSIDLLPGQMLSTPDWVEADVRITHHDEQFNLQLTAEEALTLGIWLIRHATQMQTVPGSGEFEPLAGEPF